MSSIEVVQRCCFFEMEADAQFLHEFQTGSLPFERWTHAAHIRMAYLVCRSSTNFADALAAIRQGIQHFNGLHASKLTVGFHETMTYLWTVLVWNAVTHGDASAANAATFIDGNPHLMDASVWKQYYSPALMFSPDAKCFFLPPDLKPLPALTTLT